LRSLRFPSSFETAEDSKVRKVNENVGIKLKFATLISFAVLHFPLASLNPSGLASPIFDSQFNVVKLSFSVCPGGGKVW
jgi:hypothetical protein